MKKRILSYLAKIDELLACPDDNIDWDEEIRKHLIQIEFFMHERLIHLIVTMVFAVFAVLSVFQTINNFSFGMLAVIVAFMVLLIPYIMHYYLLENGVQKMYRQYDAMLEKKENR